MRKTFRAVVSLLAVGIALSFGTAFAATDIGFTPLTHALTQAMPSQAPPVMAAAKAESLAPAAAMPATLATDSVYSYSDAFVPLYVKLGSTPAVCAEVAHPPSCGAHKRT